MSYIEKSVLEDIQRRLRVNKEQRQKRGALTQDFPSAGKVEGEIFYGNLKQVAFDVLPLKTKRNGGPASVTRILSRVEGDKTFVFTPTYEKIYGDRESFTVYVHTYELDMLGLEY